MHGWWFRLFMVWGLMLWPLAAGAEAPGGWIETHGAGLRTKLSQNQISAFVPPSRGAFTFPAPYHTEAIRITDASDCGGGSDCLSYVGYSYWRNTNNHTGSNEMLLFLSFDRRKGGAGPTLFRYNKTTDTIAKVGPLFNPISRFSWKTGEGWYFSATRPNKLYMNDGPKMLRYDVVSHLFDTVFDVTAHFGSDRHIWQMHSSNDDRIHSATLRVTSTNEDLGCVVYNETTQHFSFFAKQGTYDECHIDKSGRYLLIEENIDNLYDLESVFIDLQTGSQTTVYDQNGALAHVDMGYGYVVGSDNWFPLPNATVVWSFAPSLARGPVVHWNFNWNIGMLGHLSHTNAKPNLPRSKQYACGSNADRSGIQNEIACVLLDGSDKDLIVAPVMTNMDTPGGQTDYGKTPKGNLDITGQYFIWTTNLSGNRLDAFLVKIPSQLLTD